MKACTVDGFWLTRAALITPRGIVGGDLKIARGRIAAIRRSAPRGAVRLDVGGAYVAPGFIDLHVWGDPRIVSREAVRHGTTAFLTTLGPEPAAQLAAHAAVRAATQALPGAACVGIHLEGPFVNPARGGALPRRGMRRPALPELQRLKRASRGRIRIVTIAPELPGASEAVRWCRQHGIVASLGHSDADGATARRAVAAGARAVTHVFNGMTPLHHRHTSLLDVALTEPRLTAMVIADGIHVSPAALRLLSRLKGPERAALVTDSIQHQGWDVVARGGAYYTRGGVLAGSRLTMMGAVRNMVELAGVSVVEAVRMATEVPARLLGLTSRGVLTVGKRADLVAFDRHFRVLLTMVGGRVVYQRKGLR